MGGNGWAYLESEPRNHETLDQSECSDNVEDGEERVDGEDS